PDRGLQRTLVAIGAGTAAAWSAGSTAAAKPALLASTVAGSTQAAHTSAGAATITKVAATLMITGAAMLTSSEAPHPRAANPSGEALSPGAPVGAVSSAGVRASGEDEPVSPPEVPSSPPAVAPRRVVPVAGAALRRPTMATPASLGWTCNFR